MEPDIHIANIIGKHLNREASAEEDACLREWLIADPRNQEEYDAYQDIWQHSDKILTDKMFDIQAAWARIDARINVYGRVFNLYTWRKMAAAAAILVVVITGWWGYQHLYGPAAIQYFSAGYDNQQLVLPDGTHAHLRKGTTLSYPRAFDGKERLISLDGEGFFDVAAKANAPFRIHTSRSVVEVLGTSFLVNTVATADKVIVASGRVMFTEKDNKAHYLVLSAGQTATLSGKQFINRSVIDADQLASQTGVLEFRNVSLQAVVKGLNGYYRVNMVLSPEVDTQLIVNVRFEHQPLEEVLEEIKLSTGLGVKKEGQGMILYRP